MIFRKTLYRQFWQQGCMRRECGGQGKLQPSHLLPPPLHREVLHQCPAQGVEVGMVLLIYAVRGSMKPTYPGEVTVRGEGNVAKVDSTDHHVNVAATSASRLLHLFLGLPHPAHFSLFLSSCSEEGEGIDVSAPSEAEGPGAGPPPWLSLNSAWRSKAAWAAEMAAMARGTLGIYS